MAQDDIQGQVVDAQGNPVDGAIVELTKSYQSSPDSRGNVFRTTTDSNGNYIFTGHQEGDGTTQEWHVSAYNHDGTAYVNSFNNPGVTADLPSNAIPDSVVSRTGDNNALFDTTERPGIQIESTVEWPDIGGEISSNTQGATTAYIYDSSTGNLRGQTDISGLSAGDTFIMESVDLQPNTTYNFILDAGGSTFDAGFNFGINFPFTSDDGALSIVNGAKGQTSSNGAAHCIRVVGNVGFN